MSGKYSPDIEDVKQVAVPVLRHRLPYSRLTVSLQPVVSYGTAGRFEMATVPTRTVGSLRLNVGLSMV